jgi:hypothetical protein
MVAYKFLGSGRRSVLGGFRWPHDDWVETEGLSSPAPPGVHACRLGDLPYWLAEELWRVELAGPMRQDEHRVFARRGRLLDQVLAWDEQAASEFARACEARSGGLGVADPAAGWVPGPGAAYIAAHAAGLAAAEAGLVGRDLAGAAGYEAGFAKERAWQAAWLVSRLGLVGFSPG